MKKFLITIILLLIVTNICAIFYAIRQTHYGQTSRSSENYKWLNPRLAFIDEPIVSKVSYEVFKNNLTEIIERSIKEGRINRVAVFFRDLNDGPTFGINSNDYFIPASLLKVPLAITYLRLAEQNSALLDQRLVNNKSSSESMLEFPPAENLEEGKSYTIEDLLYRSIVYSDNISYLILSEYLQQFSPDRNLDAETFEDLGILDAWSSDPTKEDISVKSYASIFRILYNSSYLSKKFSDKVLGYLVESEFNDGLRRGVPDAILVAHKFGERSVGDYLHQLHDCGIVYYPQNPYLLCIMTEGDDFNALSEVIGIVSKAVYEEFDSRRLK
jgi:beta-lactamase class A